MLKMLRAMILVAVLLLAVIPGWANAPEIVVYGSSNREGSLERSIAKSIFSGVIKKWDNGRPIQIYVLPADHPATKLFAWEVLWMTPYAFSERVRVMSLAREGLIPRVVQTEAEMVRAVINTPNSIGYLSPTIIIRSTHRNLRVINVY